MVKQIQIEIALFENDTIPNYLYLDAVITLITKKQYTLYNTIILAIKIIYIVKKKLSSVDCQKYLDQNKMRVV